MLPPTPLFLTFFFTFLFYPFIEQSYSRPSVLIISLTPNAPIHHTAIFPTWLIYPADGGSRCLKNISTFLSRYMASYPRRPLSKTQVMHHSVLCILQEDLSQKRVALSILLMDLLSQQAERRRQLLNTLTEMEKRRWVEEEVGEYFRNCMIYDMEVPW